MGGGARDRARIAGALGIRTLDLPYPQSLADIESSGSHVAAALGRRQAAAPAAAGADRPRCKRHRPRAGGDTIWLGGGGRTVAARGLAAAMDGAGGPSPARH